MSQDFGQISAAAGPSARGRCRGICTRYKACRPIRGGRYDSGQVRCQICEIYMNIGGRIRCPCCNYRVRSRPRNLKYKAKYLAKQESQRGNTS